MALRPTRPQTRAEQLAERNAASQDAFLREVDDALREDQFLTAFKRYGKPVGAGLVAALAALGGYLWWGNHSELQTAQKAEQLTIALDQLDGNTPDMANPALAQISKGDGATAAIARLLSAGMAIKDGHKDQAVKIYNEVAADSNVPKPYRDLATVRAVATGYETMKSEEVVSRLKPMAAPGNPWFGSAGELLGLAYLKLGQKDLAGPLYAGVTLEQLIAGVVNPDVVGAVGTLLSGGGIPEAVYQQALKARARQVAGVMGFDAIDDVAKPRVAGESAAGALAPPPPAAPAPAAQGAAPAPGAAPAQPAQ